MVVGSEQKTFYIETFGCQMNFHDSEKVVGSLISEGYRQVEREEDADLPTGPASREVTLTPEHERAIIARLEEYLSRKPTQQEINLALEQARSF